jgi:hypothetical protein
VSDAQNADGVPLTMTDLGEEIEWTHGHDYLSTLNGDVAYRAFPEPYAAALVAVAEAARECRDACDANELATWQGLLDAALDRLDAARGAK